MLVNGWGVLPILRHDAPKPRKPNELAKGAGKAPLIDDWQESAAFGAPLASVDTIKTWERKCRDLPGTGVPCGSVIGLDFDFLDESIVAEVVRIAVEECGSTPFIRQGMAPKVLLVYRAAEPMPKRGFKTADGSGGLDIIAEKFQFVAYGIHPGTLQPYRWIGEHSPLTAPPSAAPAITAVQVERVIARVRELVPLREGTTKPRAPKAAPAGGGAKPAAGRRASGARNWWRRLNDAAMGNFSAWVPGLSLPKLEPRGQGYVAVAFWRASSTGRSLTERDQNLSFHSTGIQDFGAGGEDARLTPLDVVAKALVKTPFEAALWLCERLGLDIEAMKAEDRAAEPEPSVPPTYPDRTVPPAVARGMITAELDRFFGEQVPAERRARQELVNTVMAHHLAERWIPWALASHALRQWRPEAVVLKVEAGAGKTTQVFPHIVAAVRAGRRVVVSVKSLRLAEANIVPGLTRLGITARAYRGVSQPDPWCAGHKMCRDQPARAAAAAVGASSKDVCGTADSAVRCKHFNVCGVNRQRAEQPDVWVVTHGMAFTAWQDFLPAPDLLVFDESFIGAAMGESVTIPLRAFLTNTTVRGANGAVDEAQTFELQKRRTALYAALSAAPDGHVAAEALAADLYPIDAMQAGSAEWSRRPAVDLRPGMAADALAEVVADHKDAYQFVQAMSEVWAEVARVLKTGRASGSLVVRTTPAGERQLVIRPLARLSEGLRGASILVLDATPPTVEQLRNVLDCPVRVAIDQPITRSPNSILIQVINAPVSATALGIARRSVSDNAATEDERRNVGYVHNLTTFLAALWPEPRAAVFSQEELETKLNARGLPANVRTGHFNGVDGLNDFQDDGLVACIGRTLPGVREVEAEAAVTFCEPVSAVQAADHGGTRYTRERAYIRLANGGSHPVDVLRHPDPRAEAVRQQKCEFPEVQALARGRALNRREATPLLSVLIADLCLDITVDAVVDWSALHPFWRTPAEVWREGVLLGHLADCRAAFGVSERDADHIKAVIAAGVARREFSTKSLQRDILGKDFVGNWSLRAQQFRYKKAGARQWSGACLLLPNAPQGPAALKAWLEARLGCQIAEVEYVGRMPVDPAIYARSWEMVERLYLRPALETAAAIARFSDKLAAAGRPPAWLASLAERIEAAAAGDNDDVPADADDAVA